MRHNLLPFLLLPGAALLAWVGGQARAATATPEPESVGQRFEWTHRAQPLVIEGWEVRPSLTGGAGYDSNITLTGDDGPSSSELLLRAALEAARGMGAYLFNVNAAVGHTWYPDASEQDLTDADLRAAATYDARPLTLRGVLGFLKGADRTINNGIFVDGVFDPYATRPEFWRVPIEAIVDYDISRVRFVAALKATAVEYDTQSTVSGVIIPQDFRNGWEEELRLRGGYLLTPDMSFFVEGGASTTQYRDQQGNRDTWRVVTGASFEFTRLLTGEASVGYGGVSLESGGRTPGFTYGARLHWFVTELVSLTLNAERHFDGEVVTTLSGVTSAAPITHDIISLRAEWEPLRHLYIHGQAGYETEKREVNGETSDLISVDAGAAYAVTDALRLTLDGTYVTGSSDFTADVERSHAMIGLTVSY